MAVDYTFYDKNWTVLKKIKWLEKWVLGNSIDLSTIELISEQQEEGIDLKVKGVTYDGTEWISQDLYISFSDFSQYLEQLVETEKQERIGADEALQESITNEIDERESADLDIETRLTAMIADVIQSLQAEIDERRSEFDSLNSLIGQEIEDRENADKELQSNIDEEAKIREEADKELQANIDKVESDSIEAENTLQSNIDLEETARINGDNNLNTYIQTVESSTEESLNDIQSQLDKEITNRESKDTELQSNIDELESSLNQSIEDEAEERENQDTILQANIDKVIEDSVTDFDMEMDEYYTLTITLYNKDEEMVAQQDVSLPFEAIVQDGYYDEETQEIVLELLGEHELRIPVAQLVDGLVNQNTFDVTISEVTNMVLEETANRESEDTKLQNQIDAIDLQINGDEENTGIVDEIKDLQDNLAQEIIDRTTADTNLSNTISDNYNSIEKDIADLADATSSTIEQLEEDLKQDIKDVELELSADIDAIDLTLYGDEENEGLVDKVSTNTSNISTLNTNLSKEIEDRTDADGNLQDEIDDVNSDLQQEIQDREDEDTNLQSSINDLSDDLEQEIQDREDGDKTLQGNIDSLSTTVTNNYNTLNTAISTETTNRESADNTLQDNIDNLSSTVSSNYDTLNTAINNEVTNRTNADNTLQGNIDKKQDTLTATGSGTNPIYVSSSGTVSASSSTVGGNTQPIYLNSGTLTASTSTVGSSTQPIYLNSGTLTAGYTIGSYTSFSPGVTFYYTTSPTSSSPSYSSKSMASYGTWYYWDLGPNASNSSYENNIMMYMCTSDLITSHDLMFYLSTISTTVNSKYLYHPVYVALDQMNAASSSTLSMSGYTNIENGYVFLSTSTGTTQSPGTSLAPATTHSYYIKGYLDLTGMYTGSRLIIFNL